VLSISILARQVEATPAGKRPPLVPLFLLAFVVIVVANSFHLVPSAIQSALSDFSRWCIVTAIAALGAKTSLAALAQVGHRAMALMVAETAFIAVFVLLLIHLG
jgi:uncharacterized membrane protein YadS